PDLPREIERVARAQHLIRHDPQRSTLASEAEHGLDEVALPRTLRTGEPEQSAHAEDHGTVAALERQTLARELRLAVDAHRSGRVRLEVGRALGAVEDIVGREVDEPRPERLAGLSERADRLG